MAASVGSRRAGARRAGRAATIPSAWLRAALPAAVGAAGLMLALVLLVLIPAAKRLPPSGHVGVALVLALGLAFVGIGLYAWLRRPDNRTGALLAWFGVVALASELLIAEASGLYLLAIVADGLTLPIFLHLLLAFPSGRLEGRL